MGFKEALYTPFTEIDKRQGRGGHYDYIKWRHVADRMNDVFDGRWSSKVVAETTTDTDVVVRIAVTVVDTVDSMSFTQEGYGGASIRSGEEPGTAQKSAYSKALKDACRKWGVGLYLDGDNDTSGDFEQHRINAIPTLPTGLGGPSPISGVSLPTPISMPGTPTMGGSPAPPPPAPSVSAPPVPTQQVPTVPNPGIPTPPTPLGGFSNSPTMPSAIGIGMPAPISMGLSAGMAPPVSQLNMAPIQQESPDAIMADASPDVPGTLTEVQKMAINHMARARGAVTESDVLALVINSPSVGLGRTVTSIDNLSYIEAVNVIKYIKLLNESE